MNSRGQAFSVFELMIAGVVAFAILIILLMVIGGVSLTSSQDAKTVMANAISSVSPSGTTTTSEFTLKRNEEIASEDLIEKTGLDAQSMFFAKGQFGENSAVIVEAVPEDGSFIRYTGSIDLKARAKVVCKQTYDQVDTALTRYSSGTSGTAYTFDTTAEEYCGDYQPCCVIILERPTR